MLLVGVLKSVSGTNGERLGIPSCTIEISNIMLFERGFNDELLLDKWLAGKLPALGSYVRALSIINRARVKQQKEDAPPKPFPIEPEVYEDASLASAKQPGVGRANTRGWKLNDGKGEQRGSSSDYGSDRGQGAQGEESNEAMANALKVITECILYVVRCLYYHH